MNITIERECKLDERGRIPIPAEWRRMLKLEDVNLRLVADIEQRRLIIEKVV